MIIETGSAAEARDIARRLLAAAREAGMPGAVRTVHRGTRVAFSVPAELGRAVGREPDAAPAETPPAEPDRPADPPPEQPAEPEPEPAEPEQAEEAEPEQEAGEAPPAKKKRQRRGA